MKNVEKSVGNFWSLIMSAALSGFLPHDLCHGGFSRWLPAVQEKFTRVRDYWVLGIELQNVQVERFWKDTYLKLSFSALWSYDEMFHRFLPCPSCCFLSGMLLTILPWFNYHKDLAYLIGFPRAVLLFSWDWVSLEAKTTSYSDSHTAMACTEL